jgi:hypothetical protein
VVTFRCYWQPKSDHRIDEWEDGAAYSEARGVAAVADGASSSFDAQSWARDLVTAFVAAPPRTVDVEAFEAWTASVAAAYAAAGHDAEPVPQPRVEVAAAAGPPGPAAEPDRPGTAGAEHGATAADPWYIAEAAARGAFATFVGLQFTETPDTRRWRALAVGDACCFHVRGGHLLDAFPVGSPDGFDSSPDLLSSTAFRGSHGGHRLVARTGDAETGDLLFLATDAMAAWALARAGDDPSVWASLAGLDHRGFAELVTACRATGEMEDDDVTLLRAVVGPRT